ncbi:hypothetical protein BN1708_007274 [Verticillium longisporum]|uniref:Uncharacterized protein n=1 Tax=Verticillium longisporum TaxID=100787 RepID=A0A0G4MS28_VERLO|nr:hypothetical protein BN1708_007274 [Verticillium longisporum]
MRSGTAQRGNPANLIVDDPRFSGKAVALCWAKKGGEKGGTVLVKRRGARDDTMICMDMRVNIRHAFGSDTAWQQAPPTTCRVVVVEVWSDLAILCERAADFCVSTLALQSPNHCSSVR